MVEVDRFLIARAGDVAEAEGLHGFDAMQLTAAELSGCELFVAAGCSGDARTAFAIAALCQAILTLTSSPG